MIAAKRTHVVGSLAESMPRPRYHEQVEVLVGLDQRIHNHLHAPTIHHNTYTYTYTYMYIYIYIYIYICTHVEYIKSEKTAQFKRNTYVGYEETAGNGSV